MTMMAKKWKVVVGTNGSTKVLYESKSKKACKWYAQGFNGGCEQNGKAIRARLEQCDVEENGIWLVVGHNLRDDDYTPYEVLTIETNYDTARNIAMGINTETQRTGNCADVLDLSFAPKIDADSIGEVRSRLLALGHQLIEMAGQLEPRESVAETQEQEEPGLPDTLPKPSEELPELYVEVTGLSDEPRYISVADPRATFMATFESLSPGSKCRAITGHPETTPQPLLIEVVGGNAPRQVIEFGDPRVEFCDHHNAHSYDGSIARVIENPGPNDVPNVSFARKQPTSSGA